MELAELQESLPCDLSKYLQRINWAAEESNVQHFEQELRGLYPRLQQCGLEMPLIEPVRIGVPTYDDTWHGFHLTFLKVLRRWIRSEEFNLKQWNADVVRENVTTRPPEPDRLGCRSW